MFDRIGLVLLLCASLPLGAAHSASAADESSPSTLIALGRNLKLEVSENGPEQLWTLQLSNLGDTSIDLVADPGLLWFEVQVPGRASPDICRLPEPLWPTSMRRRAHLVLKPQETFSRRFDPRFFCFADLQQRLLVPNARVTPHFGWPQETAVTKVGGKRSLKTLPPRAPFVAWLMPASAAPAVEEAPAESSEGDAETTSEGSPSIPWEAPSEGLKEMQGPTLILSPSYEVWSRPIPKEKLASLTLVALAGSDAEDEKSATVTVGPFNGSSTPQQLFLRRELIDYRVVGPDGAFECPHSETGPPDFGSFSSLKPGKAESMAVRLIEVCPRGGLTRPGLYEVSASFTSKWSGQPLGIEAFVGRIETPRPALVRVRGGDRSSFFRAAAPIVAEGAGAPAAPGAAQQGQEPEAPAEGGQDGDDGHDGAEEPGAPEAPAGPDGTNVE